MVSGIVKLFYTEVVKTNMKKLNSKEYQINERAKKVQAIATIIDRLIFFIFKFTLLILAFIFSYKINSYIGIGILILEIMYLLYMDSIKNKIKENIINLRQIFKYKESKQLYTTMKKDISVLISICLIGFILDFNLAVIISLVLVAVFTFIQIFKSIKSEN